MCSFNMLFQPFFPSKTKATGSTLERLVLIVYNGNMTIEITLTLEGIITSSTNKIVSLMNAFDMIGKIGFSLESFCTVITSVWHSFLMNKQDMIFHSSLSGKTSAASFTDKWPLFFMHHPFVGIQGAG